MANPLVSVLIPAYRARDFILRPVQSLQRQSYSNWEVIIASDDGTNYQQHLHDQGITDPRLRFTSTGTVGAGPSVARNAALAIAKGDIMAVLDADDAFAPTKLERMVPQAIQYGAVTSRIRVINAETGEEFPSLAPARPASLLPPEAYIRTDIETFSRLIWDRRQSDVAWETGLFFSEDLVLGLSHYNRLEGIHHEPEALHFYYRHKKSLSSEDPPRRAGATMADIDAALLQRAMAKNLPVKNPAALDALIRFHTARMDIFKNFTAEHESAMDSYYFFEKNRDAFLNW